MIDRNSFIRTSIPEAVEIRYRDRNVVLDHGLAELGVFYFHRHYVSRHTRRICSCSELHTTWSIDQDLTSCCVVLEVVITLAHKTRHYRVFRRARLYEPYRNLTTYNVIA